MHQKVLPHPTVTALALSARGLDNTEDVCDYKNHIKVTMVNSESYQL